VFYVTKDGTVVLDSEYWPAENIFANVKLGFWKEVDCSVVEEYPLQGYRYFVHSSGWTRKKERYVRANPSTKTLVMVEDSGQDFAASWEWDSMLYFLNAGFWIEIFEHEFMPR